MDAAGGDLGRLDHYLSVDHPLKRALQTPEELVDALQDRVHLDVGNARAAKSVKARPGLSDDAIQQVMACAMERAALRERIGAQEEPIPIPRTAGG